MLLLYTTPTMLFHYSDHTIFEYLGSNTYRVLLILKKMYIVFD